MSRLRHALDAIDFARRYTVELLDTIDPADWFRVPAGGVVTHVAWQVGHLALSEYRLCLARVRGPRPDDPDVLPPDYLQTFGRDPVSAEPARYPSPADIRATFDRVHERALADLAGFPDADLDSGIDTPHRFCRTKLDCVRWCPAHEMLHTGQIGLLRRLFGHPPMW